MDKNQKRWGWGLIGPGRFAREFATELTAIERVRPVSIGSRTLERAREFADDFGFERAHGSYQELINDADVEIVYIAVPHPFHREVAEMALRAGKAVLCEKPLTCTARDSRSLCALAKDRGVFLMEAMKTGFLPAIRQAAEWIQSGAIGEPKILKADFGFPGSTDPSGRLMNPDLAGGCILDVGIYPLYLSQLLFGRAERIQASGSLTATGVEDTAVINLRHAGGLCSALTASFQTTESMDATILGTEGQITVPTFHAAKQATLAVPGQPPTVFKDPAPGMVTDEIHAVMDALDHRLLECPGHPHDHSIALAELMDEVLRQIHHPPA